MIQIKNKTKLAWRRFLMSDEGIEGMLWLRERVPNIISGEQPHVTVFTAGKSQGHKDTLDLIAEMLAVEQEQPQSLEN